MSPIPHSYVCRKKFQKVYQFRITLNQIKPAIWRTIQVPECYTFWDLHCAITDAFGWLDGHLHWFMLRDYRMGGRVSRIGLADDETPSTNPKKNERILQITRPENTVAIEDYYSRTTPHGVQHRWNLGSVYKYDLGNDLEHDVFWRFSLGKQV